MCPHHLQILTLLVCVGCATPSPHQNIPPECDGNRTLSTLTMNRMGRGDQTACRAAIEGQGGPMSIMKSSQQLQQEFGSRGPQSRQQDMPMTPEQDQQSQQFIQQIQPRVQQMSPMMQQRQGGMLPQATPPQMTPEEQEQLRLRMLQEIHQQQVAPIQPPASAPPQLNR